MYTLGRSVRWDRAYPQRRSVIRLPNYAWQREAFWYEEASLRRSRLEPGGGATELFGSATCSLLGRPVQSAHQERAWHAALSIDAEHEWLADHRVQHTVVLAFAGFVEQALSAGRQLHPDQPLRLEAVVVSKALVLSPGRQTPVETVVDANSGQFHIDSQDPQQAWTRHACGRVRVDFANWHAQAIELREFEEHCDTVEDVTPLYEWFAEMGLDYGMNFQGVEAIRTTPGWTVGQLRLPHALTAEVDRFTLCPTLFDACIQVMLAGADRDWTVPTELRPTPQLFLPTKIGLLRVHDPVALCLASREGLIVGARLAEKTKSLIRGDAVIFDSSGRALVRLHGFEGRAFPTAREGTLRLEDCLFDQRWTMQPRPGEQFPEGMPRPQLLTPASAQIAALREDYHRRDFFQEFQPAVASLATAFAVNALRELRCDWAIGQMLDADEWGERYGIPNDRLTLFRALLQRLALEGLVRFAGGKVEIVATWPKVQIQDAWQNLCRRWPGAVSELLLAWRSGTHLAGILRGEVDPQAALFPDGATDLLEDMQEDGPSFQIQNRLLQEVFTKLVRSVPGERPLRVLDVGNGTGAVAKFVLPVLPRHGTEYVLANDSEDALAARRKYHEVSGLRCALFNPAVDPLEQGFQPATFDVIICNSLSHVSRLVSLFAPDGLLILCDGPPVGKATPLSAVAWHSLRVVEQPVNVRNELDSLKFREISKISEAAPGEHSVSAVWVAHPPSDVRTSVSSMGAGSLPPESQLGTWWLFANEPNDFATAGRSRLAARGVVPGPILPASELRRIEPGRYELPIDDAAAFSELCKLAQADGLIPQAIVHLGSLTDPICDDVSIESLRESQSRGANVALALVQAVAQADWTCAPRLWLVTHSVQSAGLDPGAPLCLASSTIWGLSRVLTNELPHLKCTTIDVSRVREQSEIDSLFREIASADNEREVVLCAPDATSREWPWAGRPLDSLDPPRTFVSQSRRAAAWIRWRCCPASGSRRVRGKSKSRSSLPP